MVTLTCSVSGIDLTGATYSFFDGDKSLAGPGSSNTYSLIADLATAGGDYYCELTVNPEYLDVSGPITVRSTNIGSVSVTSKYTVHIVLTNVCNNIYSCHCKHYPACTYVIASLIVIDLSVVCSTTSSCHHKLQSNTRSLLHWTAISYNLCNW